MAHRHKYIHHKSRHTGLVRPNLRWLALMALSNYQAAGLVMPGDAMFPRIMLRADAAGWDSEPERERYK